MWGKSLANGFLIVFVCAQEAEKAMQMAAAQQAASVSASQVSLPQPSASASTSIQQQEVGAAMDVDDSTLVSASGLKRKADEPLAATGQAGEGSKKAKMGGF